MTGNGRLGHRAMALVLAGLAWAASAAGCAVSCPEGQVEVDGRCEAAASPGDAGSGDGEPRDGADGGPLDSDGTTVPPSPIALRLQIGAERVRLRPGLSVEVPVEVTADPADPSPIALEIQGLPSGVVAGALALPPGGSGTLTLTANVNAAPIGPLLLTVRAVRGDEADEAELALMLAGASGSPVATFGTDGRVTVPLSFGFALQNRLLVDDDGFVVAGIAPSSATIPGAPVLRYTKSGTLDMGFGTNGYAADTSSPPLASVLSLGRLNDQIIALGAAGSSSSATLHLRAFTARGRVNAQFGAAGSTYVDSASSVTPNAGVVVGARGVYVHTPAVVYGFRLVGTLDASFGQNGRIAGEGFNIMGMIARRDDGMLAFRTSSGSGGTIVDAFDPRGMPVAEFGVGGTAMFPFTAYPFTRPDAEGRLSVGAGFTGGEVAIVRIDERGRLDPNFGNEGKAGASMFSSDASFATAPLADGSIVTISLQGLVRRFDARGVQDENFGVQGEINLGAAYVTSIDVDEERGVLTFFAPATNVASMVLGQVWL